MDDIVYALSAAVLMLILFMTKQSILHRIERREWQKEREEWKQERKDLLDRIQAPSFAEYTNKVIKEKKAEQPEEKKEEVEFVS